VLENGSYLFLNLFKIFSAFPLPPVILDSSINKSTG